MDFLCAVHGEAYEELMFFQESAPVLGEGIAVGLQGVGDRDVLLIILPLIGDHFFKKIQTAERGLPALKGVGSGTLRPQEGSSDHIFQGGIGHEAIRALTAFFRLITVKTIITGHVALAGGRFDQDTDGGHGNSPLVVVWYGRYAKPASH